MDTDHDLLKRWSDGDAAAGDALVQRNFPIVFRFLRNKVDDADLDELAQRTFLGCLESAARFQGRARFTTFLLRIARNQLISHFRERSRTTDFDPDDLSVARVASPGPETLLALGGQKRLLLHALRQLPLSFQIVLELHYWERLSVADIASVIEAPPGTVKSRLHRAREALRTTILASEAAGDAALRHDTVSNLDDWAAALRDVIGTPG